MSILLTHLTKFNFIVLNSSDINTTISSLQNAIINSNNTQSLISIIQNQISTIENQIVLLQNSSAQSQDEIDDLTNDLDALSNSLLSAKTDIGAIKVNLNSLFDTFLIGVENIGSGPIYEAILKRRDKKQIVGYTRSINTVTRLPNNPIASTNGSPNITVTTSAAHNLNIGDIVSFTGLAAGANFNTGQMAGTYRVQSIVNATKFTLTLSSNANATSAGFGGSNGSWTKISNEGLSVLWLSGQASDSSVRQTSIGTRIYNYIIRRISTDTSNETAEVCYHKSDSSAIFTTINASPTGGDTNITCL